MLHPSYLIGLLFAAFRPQVYTTSAPALTLAPHAAELDASVQGVAATLAAPGAAMIGRPIFVRVTNADSAVTLQFTTKQGSTTLTLALGDVLVLIGATATQWAILMAPSSLLELTTGGGLKLGGELEVDGALNHDGSTAGFFGVAPATRPTAYTQTYSTADKTIANPTVDALTDSSGGTPGTTLAAITGGGAGCENATKNAIASLAAQVAKLAADNLDLRQGLTAVIDDLQALGLAQ